MKRSTVALFTLTVVAASIAGCEGGGNDVDVIERSSELAIGDDDLDIPFEEFTLDNGLRVIVHEDRKAPIIATNLWYHVGSKNESPGKTGFAHLFEHLMFNGTENYNDEYFGPFQEVGATNINGTTNTDRTNYYQTVPTTALDLALWMESDRMGHLLGAIDQDKLDEQRGVVQNEKRQGDNQPYGKAFDYITENLFPVGHPYSWSTIGSMEDLNAASLEDVREWFATYYGPNNATLVLAGDIDVATAREKTELYFGHIPPGPPLARLDTWIPTLTQERRMIVEERVSQARIYKTWPIPQWGDVESEWLALVDSILGNGRTSRFYQRLVYDEQVATDIGAFASSDEIAGGFVIWATAQPGQDLAEVERLLDEEVERFLEDGPSRDELARVVTETRAGFIRAIERVSGKASILIEGAVFGGRPDAYKDSLAIMDAARPDDLRDAARKWLSQPAFTLEIHPFSDSLTATTEDADRSEPPYPASFPQAEFPELETGELSNGMRLVVATRDAVPVIHLSLQLNSGYAADQFSRPGTAGLTLDMLEEGTVSRDALQISEELAELGADLRIGANLDYAFISLSALTENLEPSLEIFGDVILHPTFPESGLERLKRLSIAAIQREKMSPISMALRVFPPLIYGPGHAYSLPMTGSGTEASVAALQRTDLVDFHATWFKPNNATMIVVGDTNLAKITPHLEALFAAWTPGDIPEKTISTVALPEHTRVVLIDRPGSEQSFIIAGHLMAPKSDQRELAIQAMNFTFGGSFTSRINMNLREDKAWSYGVRSVIIDTMKQRPYFIYAPVQTDRTAASMLELDREFREIRTTRPVTAEEVNTSKRRDTLRLPGRWETARSVMNDIAEIVRFGLPKDYWQRYPDLVAAVNVAEVNDVARALLAPDRLTWVVVGDLDLIEADIRALNFGPVELMDADGNLLSD
ncbi:MAG: insulinase family protein [Gammaproteobacteria bacterium]|nr:MAG: insulinase family protein [Gammaproteobacteria bacterium]